MSNEPPVSSDVSDFHHTAIALEAAVAEAIGDTVLPVPPLLALICEYLFRCTFLLVRARCSTRESPDVDCLSCMIWVGDTDRLGDNLSTAKPGSGSSGVAECTRFDGSWH